MKIVLSKDFEKAFTGLDFKQKQRAKAVLALFMQNPYDSRLKNHILHGKQKGRRAISAGGDLRLIFIENNDYELVRFLSVGTHNQVY